MDTNAAISILAGALLALVVFLVLKLKQIHKRAQAKREQELAERKRKQLLDTQENIGNRIFNALLSSACHNYGSPVKVQRLKDNGGAYSIFVGWEEASCYTLGGLDYRGYPIVGINVRMAESIPITVSYGPYPDARKGTEVYYDANEDQIRMLIDVVGKHVSAYSPYETA